MGGYTDCKKNKADWFIYLVTECNIWICVCYQWDLGIVPMQSDLESNRANRPDTVREANGRFLVPPPNGNRWRKGESGNPHGAGDAYHAALKRVRARSSDIVERMVQLAELDNVDETGRLAPLSRGSDARVVASACQWLWECGWGKGRSPTHDVTVETTLTIEQRRDEAMQTLQAAFERVLQASRAQEAEASAIVIESGE